MERQAILEGTLGHGEVVSYPSEAVIFRQGDRAADVRHIKSGRVRLSVVAASGKEAVCGLLEAGSFLGEDVLTGRAERRETATAMVATELLVIPARDMIGLLHTEPMIVDQFIGHIVARHIGLEADLASQLLSSCEQRLARTLLVLAGCRPSAQRCVLPHVSQAMIAEMVGTTRSRVNVFLGRFKKLGLIEEKHGELEVTSALRRLIHGVS